MRHPILSWRKGSYGFPDTHSRCNKTDNFLEFLPRHIPFFRGVALFAGKYSVRDVISAAKCGRDQVVKIPVPFFDRDAEIRARVTKESGAPLLVLRLWWFGVDNQAQASAYEIFCLRGRESEGAIQCRTLSGRQVVFFEKPGVAPAAFNRGHEGMTLTGGGFCVN